MANLKLSVTGPLTGPLAHWPTDSTNYKEMLLHLKKLRLILKGVRISMSAMQIIFTSTGWNIAAITQHAGVNQLSRARLFSIVLGILGFGVFGNFGLI